MGTTRAKVSFCDAPGCEKAEVWPNHSDRIEIPLGYHLKVTANLGLDWPQTFAAYACSIEHVSPAVKEAERKARETEREGDG
jgi:hypothetical protein